MMNRDGMAAMQVSPPRPEQPVPPLKRARRPKAGKNVDPELLGSLLTCFIKNDHTVLDHHFVSNDASTTGGNSLFANIVVRFFPGVAACCSCESGFYSVVNNARAACQG